MNFCAKNLQDLQRQFWREISYETFFVIFKHIGRSNFKLCLCYKKPRKKHCDVVKLQSSQMRLFAEIFKHYARSLDDAATFMPRLPDSNLEWLICVLLSVSQRFSIRFPPFPIGHQKSSKNPRKMSFMFIRLETSNQTTLKHMQLSKVRKNKRANFFFPLAFLSFFSGD